MNLLGVFHCWTVEACAEPAAAASESIVTVAKRAVRRMGVKALLGR
jgi:hypothetical protein